MEQTNHPVALITGASGGIGSEIARIFAKNGYSLALHCHKNKASLAQLTEELSSSLDEGQNILCVTGDLSREEDVSHLMEEIQSSLGTIDVLVNNAAVSHVGLLQDMTLTEWQRVMNVNLTSVFLLSRAFIPSMLQNGGGRIINISSMWGRAGASCEAAYSASKGGVESLTKSLAKELSRSNIAVNAIAPGVVDTVMNDNLSKEEKAALSEEIPLGRFATAEEIADLVCYLSKAPFYLTGQVIGIDGGFI